MTNEELKKMNVNQVVDCYLSYDCGKCEECELGKKVIEIGGTFITICHLLCKVLSGSMEKRGIKK